MLFLKSFESVLPLQSSVLSSFLSVFLSGFLPDFHFIDKLLVILLNGIFNKGDELIEIVSGVVLVCHFEKFYFI